MNFGFSEEQELLRAEVRRFLDQNCPLDEVRKLSESSEGFGRHFWDRMAELGWVGLTFSEAHGGVGLGWVDLVVVLEETGRSLFPSPLISTVLAGAALKQAGSPEQCEQWLPELAAGRAIGALAVQEGPDADPTGVALEGMPDGDGFRLSGEKRLVMDAACADIFLVAFRTAGGPAVGLVQRHADGLTVEAHTTVDLTKRMGRLRLDGVAVSQAALVGEAGGAGPLLERLFDCGATAVTAEMVGAAQGALDLTVGYAKQRVQFGEPIGRFQAVKHPLAEAHVHIESFRSLCYWAAWQLDRDPGAASLAVSRAKALASETFPRIGIETVGLHGGIGYTWEYDAHLYLKRAKWARPAFGDAGWHYERIFRLAGEGN
jgi:alkylation response protein AidB-like acyl-CoA dehydrogenase